MAKIMTTPLPPSQLVSPGERLIDGSVIRALLDNYGNNVTEFTFVDANGIFGNVTNPTTTPALTLSLGAIAPQSVTASGQVTGSNLSGTNTGDQTIVLTGDVTGMGSGSFATTIGNLKVTNAMLGGSITAAKLVGTDIATVGTITAGIWNSNVIAGQYGGTGVANTGKTITLGGNLTTAGAFTTTLTVTGNTSVTFPTTGTLVSSTVTTLSALVSVGTITTGVWNAGAVTSSGNISYTGQSYGNVQTLTDASTIAWNMNLGGTAKVTPTTNRTMGAPTNIQAGGTYCLQVISGGFTLTWNAAFKWPGGVAPTSGGGTDVYTFISFDGTTLDGVGQVSFA